MPAIAGKTLNDTGSDGEPLLPFRHEWNEVLKRLDIEFLKAIKIKNILFFHFAVRFDNLNDV